MPGKEYLDVSYSAAKKPPGSYPHELAKHLAEKYYRSPGRLLDVGCGRGDQLKAFASLGYTVAGVDVSPKAAELSPEHDVKVADLEKEPLPFGGKSFDYIFCKSVIEHQLQPENMLRSCLRVLKKGGTALVLTPSWRHVYKTFYDEYTHVTPFTANSLQTLMEMSGFINIRVIYFHQLPFLWKYPDLKVFTSLIAKLPIPYRPAYSAPWPEKLNKLIRFSKEVMLLAMGRSPGRVGLP